MWVRQRKAKGGTAWWAASAKRGMVTGAHLRPRLWLAPRAAFVEGYGGPLVVFARQRTKRLWYTLFLALVVLVQAKRAGLGEGDHEKVKWAYETAEKSVVALKDAPCY